MRMLEQKQEDKIYIPRKPLGQSIWFVVTQEKGLESCLGDKWQVGT